MRAAIINTQDLITRATARGIDLSHVAGVASNTHGIAKKRRMSFEERKEARGRPITETVDGRESRIGRAPYWSHAELGIVAGGKVKGRDGQWHEKVPRMPWLAVCYSIAGDVSGYWELHRGLMVQELRMATRDGWPHRVQKSDGQLGYYTCELAELVLDADAHKRYFTAAPALYAICAGVSEETWGGILEHRYRALAAEYERWLATGKGVISHWLSAAREDDAVALEVVVG